MSRGTHCGACGAPWNGKVCTECGHGSERPAGDWWQCSHMDAGRRCARAGSMSHSTLGGGPWVCGQHFRGLVAEKKGSAPVGLFAGIKAQFKRPVDREADEERRALQAGL